MTGRAGGGEYTQKPELGLLQGLKRLFQAHYRRRGWEKEGLRKVEERDGHKSKNICGRNICEGVQGMK